MADTPETVYSLVLSIGKIEAGIISAAIVAGTRMMVSYLKELKKSADDATERAIKITERVFDQSKEGTAALSSGSKTLEAVVDRLDSIERYIAHVTPTDRKPG